MRRLERRIQDMINPWTAKVDSLSSKLAELVERLEALEEKVNELEHRREAAPPQPPIQRERGGGHGYQAVGGQERRTRRRSAIERLREQGVVFEHDAQWLRDRNAFFERLRREGALVFEIGGERVAVDPEFWERFREKLAELPTANDEEARFLLGKQHYDLFRKLKEAGVIYFDAGEKRWKFAEEPKPV